MPTSSPPRPPHNPAPRRLRLACSSIIAIAILAAAFATASAQTLARPGWDATGVNTDPWWQHSVFYKIDPTSTPTDFKDLTSRLESLRSLGVDALILPAPNLPTQPANSTAPAPENPALNDLDELIHQCSLRGMRILLTLPTNLPDPFSVSRFWLSRGVAGLQVATPPGADTLFTQAVVEALRRITGATVGQRIVLSNLDPIAAAVAVPTPSTRRAPVRRTVRQADPNAAQLQIDSPLSHIAIPDAPTLRAMLNQSFLQPNILLDLHRPSAAPDPYPALANAIAAILLTTHSAALIDSSENLILNPSSATEPAQPAPPPAPTPSTSTFTLVAPPATPHAPKPPDPKTVAALALTDWYRQLAVLHHGNAALRLGNPTFLNFDQQNTLAWVAHTPTNSALTPPVVVLCNLSSSRVKVALGDALKGLNLRGTYLRTLLRSDKAMGPQDLNAVDLPPFSVYIGELHR